MAGKKKVEGKLSIRDYAKTVGCSHTAVRKAIDEGKITAAAWDGEYIFNKEAADREFLDLYNATITKQGFVPAPVVAVPVVAPAPSTVHSDEITELRNALAAERGKEAKGAGFKWNGGPVPTDLEYKEAIRVSQILMAESQRVKNDEQIGHLVRKIDVDKQLQVAGIEIRKTLERLPVRVVDTVLAAKNRTEALQLMEDEIRKTLESLEYLIKAAL